MLSRGIVLLLLLCAGPALGQTTTPPPGEIPKPGELEKKDKRILGFLANYKTVPDSTLAYRPLTTREKFYIARRDSFDPPMFVVAGFLAGMSHAGGQYPEWGGGMRGFGKRYAAALGDQAIGNYLSEAILPSALGHDPRYFRLGTGSKKRRVAHALTRIFVARNDRGGTTFNYSEVAGTAAGSGLASLYYPAAQRNFRDVTIRTGMQLGFDSLSNLLKEFWPDFHNRKRKAGEASR